MFLNENKFRIFFLFVFYPNEILIQLLAWLVKLIRFFYVNCLRLFFFFCFFWGVFCFLFLFFFFCFFFLIRSHFLSHSINWFSVNLKQISVITIFFSLFSSFGNDKYSFKSFIDLRCYWMLKSSFLREFFIDPDVFVLTNFLLQHSSVANSQLGLLPRETCGIICLWTNQKVYIITTGVLSIFSNGKKSIILVKK